MLGCPRKDDKPTERNFMSEIAQSAEAVALQLMESVFRVENKALARITGQTHATRQEILDTYAECLAAARGHRKIPRD
jgi:hypothetical protein